MAILSSDDLLSQAEALIGTEDWPKQVDLRRAISAAYYGVFHFLCAEAANRYVGKGRGRTDEPDAIYTAAYRSPDHRLLLAACRTVRQNAFYSQSLRRFAEDLIQLQLERNKADYDPAVMFLAAAVRVQLSAARNAVAVFQAESAEQQESFLSLLLFPRRKAA